MNMPSLEMITDMVLITDRAKQCRERWRNHLDPSINKSYVHSFRVRLCNANMSDADMSV
jgi:hypothetical protein